MKYKAEIYKNSTMVFSFNNTFHTTFYDIRRRFASHFIKIISESSFFEYPYFVTSHDELILKIQTLSLWVNFFAKRFSISLDTIFRILSLFSILKTEY